jgi:hypothetical protein
VTSQSPVSSLDDGSSLRVVVCRLTGGRSALFDFEEVQPNKRRVRLWALLGGLSFVLAMLIFLGPAMESYEDVSRGRDLLIGWGVGVVLLGASVSFYKAAKFTAGGNLRFALGMVSIILFFLAGGVVAAIYDPNP